MFGISDGGSLDKDRFKLGLMTPASLSTLIFGISDGGSLDNDRFKLGLMTPPVA